MGTLVLLSGGQDSGTCLFWAVDQIRKGNLTGPLHALSVDYGQRHSVELLCAERLAMLAGVEMHHHIPFGGLMQRLNRKSALINPVMDVNAPSLFDDSLPASFVPGRNIFLFTTAAVIAGWNGITDIVAGMCQTDYSGYPDCREDFVQQMETLLVLGLSVNVNLHTPLMHLSKAETWKLAADLGCLRIIIEETHTDYNGNRGVRNEWGYGLLDNPASELRAKGYFEAKERGWLGVLED